MSSKGPVTPDTSWMEPPISPAKKACPGFSMLGANLCGTDSATNGINPTASSTMYLGGTKLKKEKITSATPAPAPNCTTILQLMCSRHSHERQPLAVIWITP